LYQIFWFKWMPIDSIWIFHVYDVLSLHFVSLYGHKDLPTCQNIGRNSLGTWNYEMYDIAYAFKHVHEKNHNINASE